MVTWMQQILSPKFLQLPWRLLKKSHKLFWPNRFPIGDWPLQTRQRWKQRLAQIGAQQSPLRVWMWKVWGHPDTSKHFSEVLHPRDHLRMDAALMAHTCCSALRRLRQRIMSTQPPWAPRWVWSQNKQRNKQIWTWFREFSPRWFGLINYKRKLMLLPRPLRGEELVPPSWGLEFRSQHPRKRWRVPIHVEGFPGVAGSDVEALPLRNRNRRGVMQEDTGIHTIWCLPTLVGTPVWAFPGTRTHRKKFKNLRKQGKQRTWI